MASKYFDRIIKAEAEDRPIAELPPFDLEAIRSRSVGSRLVGWLFSHPHWWMSALRRFRPILVIGKIAVVTRQDDVREVLDAEQVFQTPFGREMRALAGADFILGLQDGPDYQRLRAAVLDAFRRDDVDRVVRPLAAAHSAAILRHAGAGFDAARDLLRIVPVRIVRDYYGIEMSDERRFAEWGLALGNLFFGDLFGSRVARDLGRQAALGMRADIERSIDRVMADGGVEDTPLARLVRRHLEAPAALSRDEIVSLMMGMIAGFAPTNLLQAGNCLHFVLEDGDARRHIEAAIAAGDEAGLHAALREAMRFCPINPGPFRYAAADHVVAAGTARQRFLRKGTTVWPMTQSAMFDPAAVVDAHRFDPRRDEASSMVFGRGLHACIGASIAQVQIAETFKALFALPNLRRLEGTGGRMTRIGPFPDSLRIDFDLPVESRAVDNSFVTIAVPVRPSVSAAEIRAKLAELGNPCADNVAEVLNATGTVHFASMIVVGEADERWEKPGDPRHLVLEFSADHSPREAIAAFARHGEPIFRPLFEFACDLPNGRSFEAFLTDHALDIGPSFGKVAGLAFCGTPGHSVARIRAEDGLDAQMRVLLNELPPEAGTDPVQRLQAVREALAARGGYDWAFRPAPDNLEGRDRSPANAVRAVLTSAWFGGALLALFLVLLLLRMLFGSWAEASFMLLAVVAALAAGAYLLFRRDEKSSPQETGMVDPERFDRIAALENHMAHNHLAAISTMKPGYLRQLGLRAAFFAVESAARHVFRPGYLSDIGTIHYARWVQLPGTGKLLFFSNYGGSWESYLEDFITKAHKGLTGIWSNTLRFPRTDRLFFGGATDGDRFKRWARLQQAPSLFWYSAYPDLDTRRIRMNAATRRGLATAQSQSEAQAWLESFSVKPRPESALEAHDIQSIFFGGIGRLSEAEMVAVTISPDASIEARRDLVAYLAANVTTGDAQPEQKAMIVGLGPRGLEALGLREIAEGAGCGFPLAFLRGMVSPDRTRILGDRGASAPSNWMWGNDERAADLVVIRYAADARLLAEMDADFARLVRDGIAIVHRLRLTIEKSDGYPIEHFGFRDNISQPYVEGMSRARGRIDPQHRLSAGEFLLGYPDQEGRVPPAVHVAAGRDRECRLASFDAASAPWGSEPMGTRRDFGRNGSFLVIRQIEQHVDLFDEYCRDAAHRLDPAGDTGIDAEWVGARMLGRWKNGTSLVRHPERPGRNDADNAFYLGSEDPRGLRCPLGSHIRRANPRDSLGPHRDREIRLSKRHRILRIGRTYGGKGADDDARGMLFMCLNADIERQFEFIQQTWLMNGGFEGLRSEVDPLVGHGGGSGTYTIPIAGGGARTLSNLPDFTVVRGGGYFFLPSRRALRFLASVL